MASFGEEYSRYYDLLYGDKDYGDEVRYITRLFDRYSPFNVKRILELGCGTGNHAIPLAKKGFKISGIDLSEHMLRIAKSKAKSAGVADMVTFQVGDMRKIPAKGKFDAGLCMFAAFGYLPDLRQAKEALVSIRRHLRPHALLIFDVWNGLAVLTVKPTQRTREVQKDSLAISRSAKPKLDVARNICSVKYKMIVRTRTGPTKAFAERHQMRYYFPGEIDLLLMQSGFDLLSIHPFKEPSRKLTVKDWNITAIAKAV